MKIFCVGRNYADHAKELKNEIPTVPVIFMKPDTAILKDNAPFYYPEFSKEIHYETELVVKIDKEGKFIEEKFAHKYYQEIGLGIDFTARDLQNELKAKGLPWELAKGFNGSAPISNFIAKSQLQTLQDIQFSLHINNEEKQIGDTADMIFTIDYLISFISKYFTLKKGDLLFTGTPSGVGAVKIGDRLVGKLKNIEMFNFEVR
ncbi:MAG: fumarylacetoacetate hydrolase family protein [Cytophagales bacterium]